VIGIGNEFRGDDGIGLFAARKLKGSLVGRAEIVESSGEGAELMNLWAGRELVFAIDAVHSGAVPGRIHRFELPNNEIPGALFPRHSTHAFGLLDAIELGRALDNLPARMVVYGIEGRFFETGAPLSAEVEKAAAEVAALILSELI
jgi:hydrogenase maturation protease